jgi:ubiquinone/menaquinone biosynthesis C-methylase UbiE
MADMCLSSFERPSQHEAVSDILRRRSTNPTDVRAALLHGLDLSHAGAVLDLGCGFGFMTEAIAQHVAPAAHIVGVDACPANEAPYLARVTAAGRTGQFVCRRIQRRLDWPDKSFDLVVASYALYFFPEVLPEVARVLAPQGMLLAVTHTEASSRDLADVLDLQESGSLLLAGVRDFSAESAAPRLARWFEDVGRTEYDNSLVFDAAHEDELLAYLRFKLLLVAPQAALAGELAGALAHAAEVLACQGRVVLEKSDVAFRCTGPRYL